MSQPVWKCVAQLGDATPEEYGGYWVFIDETGVYHPEAEYLEVSEERGVKSRAYRFILEPHTYIDGVLSENEFQPKLPVWYADDIKGIASSVGIEADELRRLFCSADPCERAEAYRCLLGYHSIENLDEYPLELTRREVRERYADPRFAAKN